MNRRHGRSHYHLPRDTGRDPSALLPAPLPVEPSNTKPYEHYLAESRTRRSRHEVPVSRPRQRDHDPSSVQSAIERVRVEMQMRGRRSSDVVRRRTA